MKQQTHAASGKKDRSSRKGGTVFPFLPLIAFAAFVLRFAVSCELIRNDPATWAPSPITDMKTYLDLADGILRGQFPAVFYYQPFYYAVFLPLCRLAGGVWLLALIQSVLGGVSVWLAGLCARMTAGRKAGIFAALLLALCGISIYFTPYALLEVLQAFWIILLLYLTLRLWRRPALKLWIAAGLVLGCSILTRGNGWCFLPMLLCTAFRRSGWKQTLLRIVLLLGFTLLPQLPFSLYNTIRSGHPAGPSTAGGAVLAFGNNPEGAPAGLEIPYPKTYELWLSKEKEISIPRRMLHWFMEEPAAFLEQQFEKCMLFWDATDYPNNITEANAQQSSIMRTVRFLPSGILLMLGLAGLLSGFYRRYFRRRPRFLLTAGFLVLYAASICAFYILARFRVPAMPLLATAGGIFLVRLFRRRISFGVRVRLAGIGAAAAFVVYGFMPLYSFTYEPAVLAAVRPDGVQTEFETSPYVWPNPPAGPCLLIADHASVLKGGWLGAGNRFTAVKRFCPKRLPRGDRALLVLPVFGGDGSVTITVNGVRKRAAVENRELRTEVPCRFENGEVILEIELSDPIGDWTCAVDARRNYGRTLLNGQKVPYELAAFLIVPIQP